MFTCVAFLSAVFARPVIGAVSVLVVIVCVVMEMKQVKPRVNTESLSPFLHSCVPVF